MLSFPFRQGCLVRYAASMIRADPAESSSQDPCGQSDAAPQSSLLYLERALLPSPLGWQDHVWLLLDRSGIIQRLEVAREGSSASPLGMGITDRSPPITRLAGSVIPGLVNLHSHAFQRAMAGLTEHAGTTPDSFWSWRQLMYQFLERLGPDEVEAIAAQLYVELLCSGYTTVTEFHYLHHDPQGSPYADPAELALRIVCAAQQVGMPLTLLPVLYQNSGFGGAAPLPAQRRFLLDDSSYARLLQQLHSAFRGNPLLRLGMAPHSLRAVTPDAFRSALQVMDSLDSSAPVHLHIAEQEAEVSACLAHTGMRPVQWLLENAPALGATLGPRYCLVHATQLSDTELAALARSGAVVGLCPTTEANLGDGLFPAQAFLAAGGAMGIGSDSHVCTDPLEELRLLEYGQRLIHKRRNLLVNARSQTHGGSVGASLLAAVWSGGAKACAQPVGAIAVGARADLLTLQEAHPSLCGRRGDVLLDSAIFGPGRGLVRDVWVAGRRLVCDGHHPAAAVVAKRYAEVMSRLL